MKDVIIIEHDPLIQRIKDGFCIDYLLSKGVNITYLDLSNFYFPGLKAPYECKEEYVVKLNTEKEIISYLSRIDFRNTIIISEALANWKSRRIYRYLSKKKATVIKISIYALSGLVKRNFFQKIKALGFSNSIKQICFRLYQKIFRFKIWDEVVSSTKEEKSRWRINHPDYEYFLTTKDLPSSDDYIVFLDECFPTHPEIQHWYGKDLSKFADSYRKSMTNLFDYLEETFNKKVIICAHPKSSYEGNEFGNHKIVKGETAKYVRNSFFTLLHVSSSSVYALLNNKPLYLLSSPEYKHNLPSLLSMQKELSSILGVEVNDVNEWRPQLNEIHQIDPERRRWFINKYLTDDDIDSLTNGEIIYQILETISDSASK